MTSCRRSTGDDKLVAHTGCLQAVLDAAPTAPPPRNHRAQAAAIRRQVLASGDLFATSA